VYETPVKLPEKDFTGKGFCVATRAPGATTEQAASENADSVTESLTVSPLVLLPAKVKLGCGLKTVPL
jgi:hypothetical protein